MGEVTKRIIKTDGNGLKLSLLTLCFVMLVFSVLVLCTLPTVWIETGNAEELSFFEGLVFLLSSLAIAFGVVFLVMPVASGIIYYAMYLSFGLKPYFLHVFTPFEKGYYLRSIAVQIIILVRMLAVGLPLVGGLSYLPIFFADYRESSIFLTVSDSAFIICATVAAALVGAYISSFLFFAPYLITVHKRGVFAALSESCRMSRERHVEIIKMTVRGLLDVAISALSFMVLYVIYAMPKMSVSYFVYCYSVIENDDTILEQI